MSHRLITQLAEEKPRVLLVSRASELADRLALYLQRQSLEVVKQESLIKFDDREKLLKETYYKIILLGDGKENSENLKNLPSLSNLVVITLITSLDEVIFDFNLDHQIIGLDVVDSVYFQEKFGQILKNIDSGILIDPKVDFYLQNQEAFLHIVKQGLLVPNKEKILVIGRKHTSLSILDETSRLLSLFFHIENLQIKTGLNQFSKLNFSDFERVSSPDQDLPSLLEGLVRQTYHNRPQSVQNPTSTKDQYHQQNLTKPVIKNIDKSRDIEVVTQTSRVSSLLNESNIASQITSKEHLAEVKTVESSDLNTKNVTNATIDDRLSQLFKEKRVDEKVERVQEFVKETKKIKKTSKKRKVLFSLGLLMTIAASTLLVFASVFWFSIQAVEKQLEGVFGQISQATAQVDYTNLTRAANFLENQTAFYNQVLPPEMLSDAENVLEITKRISEFNQLSQDYQNMVLNSVQVALGKDLLKDTVDVQKQAKLSQALQEISSKLLSRLSDLMKAKTTTADQEKIDSFVDLIESKKNSLVVYQQLAPVLDELLGQTKKKTYAIVFQNNQELRPTGGFLQAIAMVTVDQGMVVDSQVYSSYELDQKLGGAVVPPDEILKLLGENKWYLRDSNWDPDFVKSGKQIGWFIEQQLNKKVDGVIGINLFVLQNFLKEMGPLDLAEFNEVITDKNLFERSEFHSEIKLVDSSNVEDYQAKLLKYFIRDLTAKGQENPQKLLTALKKSLQEKQMTLYFEHLDLAQAFSGLGWTGELVVPQCPTQLSTLPCHVDALVVNEANIGINKANYHTTRQDSHEIEIANNQVEHHRTIILNNEAFSNAWPKGEYRSYFRFYLPEHAQSVVMTIDGQKIKEKDVLIAKQGNNLVLGLLVSTPIKSKKTIELNYSLPLEFSKPYSYVFFSQKQPGTNDILQNVTVRHSPDLSPTLIAPKAEVSGDTVTFQELAEDHAFIGISFK